MIQYNQDTLVSQKGHSRFLKMFIRYSSNYAIYDSNIISVQTSIKILDFLGHQDIITIEK